MATKFKTGKKPAKYDKKQLHLSHFEITRGPRVAPEGFDSSAGMYMDNDSWGMLGNDNYGDCVWAGADHETEILTFLGHINAAFDERTALDDYADDTGFDPNDPNTDQGTDMGDAMKYRRKTGVVDIQGDRHKIGAYLALEPGNFHQLLEALYAFQVVGIGIEFPESAMDQYNDNKPWTLVSSSPTEGGHYIPACGRPSAESVYIITWARKMRMTKRFYEKYNDESYVFVSQEALVNGVSPEGYDLTELNAILAAL